MQLHGQPDLFSAEQVREGVLVAFGDRTGEFSSHSVLHTSRGPQPDEAEGPPVIVSIDRSGNHTLMVEFSDGSIAFYGVEELLKLRPDRIKPVNDLMP